MTTYYFVRHAQSLAASSLPPSEWALDPSAGIAVAAAAQCLQGLGVDFVCSSTERKARETGEMLGRILDVDVILDERLNEVHRPFIESPTTFFSSVRNYLNNATISGWEPHSEVRARFRAVVDEKCNAGTVVFVSHGTAMSLFLVEGRGADAAEFWNSLLLPDVWQVEPDALRRLTVEANG